MFCPRPTGRFRAAVATAYETAGMMAMCSGSEAPTRRAKSSRTRSLSSKKSGVWRSAGARLRRIPAMPAASTAFGSGLM